MSFSQVIEEVHSRTSSTSVDRTEETQDGGRLEHYTYRMSGVTAPEDEVRGESFEESRVRRISREEK